MMRSLVFLFILYQYCFVYSVDVEQLQMIVLSKIPHDRHAFTQGLAIEDDKLYESTGRYGQSSLRCINLKTGEVIQKIKLSSLLFGEGIAVFPQSIYQLTWKENLALLYNRESLKLIKTFSLSGEGWGLCKDKESLWMSNGTSVLIQMDHQSLTKQNQLTVRWQGQPVDNLNDLECVENDFYINVFGKDYLLRVDKVTGEVTGVVDASHLLSQKEKSVLNIQDVFNGIAYSPKTNSFFVTGKYWPWIFEVRIVPQ